MAAQLQQATIWNFIHPDAKARSDASGLGADYFGESLTNQADAESADINNILNRYIQTGIIEHRDEFQGRYGDFVDAPTYQESLNHVIAAREMFNTIPAKIRAQFDNDPAKFLDFAQDPKNQQALVEMGLVDPAMVQDTDGADAPSSPPPPSDARPLAGAADDGSDEEELTSLFKQALKRNKKPAKEA